MANMIRTILPKMLTVIGIVFMLYGLILCVVSNFNTGVALIFALGILGICGGIFYNNIEKLTATGFFKFLKFFAVALLCIEFLLIAFLAIYGQNDTVNYTEDVVIVLGAGVRGEEVTPSLKFRLDKAIEYHRKNPAAFIVVTGGQGPQETVTEAFAMEKYLIANGVDKNKIIKEEKATSTAENLRFSKEMLDAYFNDDYDTVIITNNFHIFRGTSIAKREGFNNVFHMHAGLPWYNLLPCYLRESLAVLKMFLIK